jgi:hypothetical protein
MIEEELRTITPLTSLVVNELMKESVNYALRHGRPCPAALNASAHVPPKSVRPRKNARQRSARPDHSLVINSSRFRMMRAVAT